MEVPKLLWILASEFLMSGILECVTFLGGSSSYEVALSHAQGRHHWKLLKDQAERLLAGGCPLLATEKVHIYFNSSFCRSVAIGLRSFHPRPPEMTPMIFKVFPWYPLRARPFGPLCAYVCVYAYVWMAENVAVKVGRLVSQKPREAFPGVLVFEPDSRAVDLFLVGGGGLPGLGAWGRGSKFPCCAAPPGCTECAVGGHCLNLRSLGTLGAATD